jgi:hypothetical protein
VNVKYEKYDIFEQLPDGSVMWWGCITGLENVQRQLQALAIVHSHEFFAMNTMTREVVGRVNSIQ